ncbi:MAG: hypothetical protein PUD96_05810 [Coriobacteriaceae bacterium]|nr:hypothetical protein [Coriobacteriaceae bacterium]
MKKFIISVVCILFVACCVAYAYATGLFYINLRADEPVSTAVVQEGRVIRLDQGRGLEEFEIRGVDMGAGIPGHYATDYAIDKETYLRWFGQIKAMGANTLRVYILQNSAFYQAFYEYNSLHADDPLYLLHGVWLDDYVLNSHSSAFDPEFIDSFKEDCRTVVDAIHGQRALVLGRKDGTGSYTRDVSAWVIGYILGVEWEAPTVAYTDHSCTDKAGYQGAYMGTTEEATPFESMLAQVGDDLLSYETNRYRQQRLVAFSNWPTTDAFDYPTVVQERFEHYAKVDVSHITLSEQCLAGTFASYHVYPYYPDFMRYVEGGGAYRDQFGRDNAYQAYLKKLADYYDIPVVISEFGVPSSRGMAQLDVKTGRNQGAMSEDEQGQAIVRCYADIRAAGCAGCCIFTWQDEWFKRTWNTMANVDISKAPYWSDYQTNEQYFGLLSFDPGEQRSVSYVDGDDEEWGEADVIGSSEGRSVSVKYDEKFVYLMVRGSDVGLGTRLYLPFDITPKSGSNSSGEHRVSFSRAADFLMVLDGADGSRLLVQERYEVLRPTQLRATAGEDPYADVPAKDSSRFVPIELVLQTLTDESSLMGGEEGNAQGESGTARYQTYETGKLTYGDANPAHEAFNSMADFCYGDGFVEVKLPWQLLNFSNPSQMQVHDDYYEHYGVENLTIDALWVGAGDGSRPIEMFEEPLKGWGTKVSYHERLKESYYYVQEMWTADDPVAAADAMVSRQLEAEEKAGQR